MGRLIMPIFEFLQSKSILIGMRKKIWNWFLYLTNNEQESRHEEHFDIAFFIINTVAVFIGVYLFIKYNEPQWVPILVIEYTWALDNMRHNRP